MPHLTHRLVQKLSANTALAPDDVRALEALPITTRNFSTQSTILREGEQPSQCRLIIEGLACRSKTTHLGKRQILSVHIPGDFPDIESLHLPVMDHDLTTLSHCIVGFIGHDAMRALTRARPMIAEALWRSCLIEAATFREWIINVGRRSAISRLAHLLTEIMERLQAVGLAVDGRFELPMTQLDLADALGLSPVHVNRVVQELRRSGLIELHRSTARLVDMPRLRALADFDSLYLHQNEPGRLDTV